MSATPSWRVKSKPCQFYRKGRCIFGEDRCNFLHTMNDWSDESTLIESKLLHNAPTVKVLPETPPPVSLRSVCSPPRSPRTANLLLALKGVIGEDEEEEYIDDLSFEAVDDDDAVVDATEASQNTGLDASESSFDHSDNDPGIPPPSPTHSGLLSPVEFSDLQLKHLSLLHHSHSDSTHRSRDSHHNPSLSQDSGFYDSLGSPNSQWVSPTPMVLSPPRSPAPSSTFELLASPFGSPSTRLMMNPGVGLMSPRLGGPFMPRLTPSHSPLASEFPVEAESRPTEPDLELDSPTEYYKEKKKERDQLLEYDGQETARAPQMAPGDDEDEQDRDEDYTEPVTARWDAEDQETIRPFFLEPAPPPRSKSKPDRSEGQFDDVLEVQEDVQQALRRRSESPLDYLRTPEAAMDSSSFSPQDDAQGNSTFISDDNDETAQLAYLASSSSPEDYEEDDIHDTHANDEDDTLNSLYDVYSDIDSESDDVESELEGSDEEDEQLNGPPEEEFISRALPSHLAHSSSGPPPRSSDPVATATPLSLIRERVFTPPPSSAVHSSSTASSPSTAHPLAVFTPPPLPTATATATSENAPLHSPIVDGSNDTSALIRERVFTPPPFSAVHLSSTASSASTTHPLPVFAPSPPIATATSETPSSHSSIADGSNDSSSVIRERVFTPPPSSAVQSPSSASSPSTAHPLPVLTSSPPTATATSEAPPSPHSIADEADDLYIPLARPTLTSVGRRESRLRPLRMSTILTNFAPVPVITSSPGDSAVEPQSRADDASFAPSTSSSLDPSNSISNANRLSVASTTVSSSASSSDLSISNAPLLSSSLSTVNVPGQQYASPEDMTIPASTPHDHAPAPPAVTNERQSMHSTSSSTFSHSTILSRASQLSDPTNKKRSSIYYVRDGQRNPLERTRSYNSSEPGAPEPRTAPLVRPPAWEARQSFTNGSVRSLGTPDSRPVSRTGLAEVHLPEQDVDSTMRQENAVLPPALSPRRSVRESQPLQIQASHRSSEQEADLTTSRHGSPGPGPMSRSSSAASLSVPVRTRSGSPENVSPHRLSPARDHGSPSGRASGLSRPTTPRPTLLFAIASDNPEEVERVLEQGDDTSQQPVDVNDAIGPQAQSALAFTLGNDGLKNKLQIVKRLLGHGADPSKADLKEMVSNLKVDMDPATKYYLSRADTPATHRIDALMKRSVFRPLIRMRYGIVGQDRALEQLYRVLSIQSEKISKAPVVVFLCGPSGHGKSMLAHQFGSLLDVPTHTVNMTTLRSADDIWRSYSISSSEDAPPCSLIEFLANNEGKKCVVVLDEIEKTEQKALWSLLVPWELGRCTYEANSRTIDVRNVIWVGTSNIGNDLVLEYHRSRQRPEEMFSRNEYVELMGILRPHVSDQLGASVLSRVSAILPFVPFTTEEKVAIASEFLQQSAAEHLVDQLSKEQREAVVMDAVKEFVPSEGVRSLYRAVSDLLVDSLDF